MTSHHPASSIVVLEKESQPTLAIPWLRRHRIFHTLLKVAPALHRDLAAVKLALILIPGFLHLLARRLPRFTPAEVVEFPEGIRR